MKWRRKTDWYPQENANHINRFHAFALEKSKLHTSYFSFVQLRSSVSIFNQLLRTSSDVIYHTVTYYHLLKISRKVSAYFWSQRTKNITLLKLFGDSIWSRFIIQCTHLNLPKSIYFKTMRLESRLLIDDLDSVRSRFSFSGFISQYVSWGHKTTARGGIVPSVERFIEIRGTYLFLVAFQKCLCSS